MAHRPESLGDRIAHQRRLLAVRLRRDVSQADLARMLDVSAPTVSRWEADEKAPRPEALAALAKLFGVSLPELHYGLPADVKQGATGTPAKAPPAAKKKRA